MKRDECNYSDEEYSKKDYKITWIVSLVARLTRKKTTRLVVNPQGPALPALIDDGKVDPSRPVLA